MRWISSSASSAAARIAGSLSPHTTTSKRVAMALRANASFFESAIVEDVNKKAGFAARRNLLVRETSLAQFERAVGNWLDDFAVVGRDLAALLIEQAHNIEPFRHFSQGDHRLHLHGEVNVGVGFFASSDTIEPVPFVHGDVFARP